MILGIDPGAKGGLAVITDGGWLHEVHDMTDLTGSGIGTWLHNVLINMYEPVTVAWVEQVHSMPGQGVASTFKFGTNYGALLGGLGALAIPVRNVTPAKWKKALGLPADKTAARQRAAELWPARADWFRRVKDDGRAESALIAEYGRRFP